MEMLHEQTNEHELSWNSARRFPLGSTSGWLQSQSAKECLHPPARSNWLPLSTPSVDQCVRRWRCWWRRYFPRRCRLCPTLRNRAGRSHTHTHAQLIRDAGPNSSTPLFRQDVMEGSEKDPMGSESPPGYGGGFHSSVIAAFSTPPIPIDTNPFHMNPNPNHRIQTKGALGYTHSHD